MDLLTGEEEEEEKTECVVLWFIVSSYACGWVSNRTYLMNYKYKFEIINDFMIFFFSPDLSNSNLWKMDFYNLITSNLICLSHFD